MEKKFPKRVYITRIMNEDDKSDVEYFVDENLNILAERDGQDTEVAVYEFVKTGRVVKTSKVVFDE